MICGARRGLAWAARFCGARARVIFLSIRRHFKVYIPPSLARFYRLDLFWRVKSEALVKFGKFGFYFAFFIFLISRIGLISQSD